MPIHIEAEAKDVSNRVLLVGDPDRATFIAENFLTDAQCYNRYRHMYGYTGLYNNKRVSVQTAGMGSPSVTIVIEELRMLGAQVLLRIGTCGTMREDLSLGDSIIVTGAHSSHGIYARDFPGATFSAVPDFALTSLIFQAANNLNSQKTNKARVHTGVVLCSEIFYEDSLDLYRKYADYGTLAVEMETYPLFYLGAKYGIKTGAILTISDQIEKKSRALKEVIQKSVEVNTHLALQALVDI